MDYPFDSIHINGRDVRIADILNGSVSPQSPFESSSFLFIHQWHRGDRSFEQPTSGSTGAPKTISIARTSMEASAKLTQQALDLKTRDSALLCLDPNYIAGKMMIVRAFEIGMKLIAVDPSLNPFEKLSHHQSIDFTALIPAQLTEILQSEYRNRLHEIRNIIVGGAPLNEKAIKMVAGFRSRIYSTYGMTETVSHIALQPVNGPEASEYFKVLPGIRIEIDERGCLKINVPFLKEEITTTDIVEIKSATEFKWLGRSDSVINSAGVKIIPEKLEAQIANVFINLDLANRFVISSIPDPVLGNKLVLLIEGNLPISGDRLSSALQQALPRYHNPKQIIVNATLVMAENGKINRDETRKKNWDLTREND